MTNEERFSTERLTERMTTSLGPGPRREAEALLTLDTADERHRAWRDANRHANCTGMRWSDAVWSGVRAVREGRA